MGYMYKSFSSPALPIELCLATSGTSAPRRQQRSPSQADHAVGTLARCDQPPPLEPSGAFGFGDPTKQTTRRMPLITTKPKAAHPEPSLGSQRLQGGQVTASPPRPLQLCQLCSGRSPSIPAAAGEGGTAGPASPAARGTGCRVRLPGIAITAETFISSLNPLLQVSAIQ